MTRHPVRRLSIEWKLPLGGGLLLLAAIGAVLWAGYINIRRSDEAAAFARLPDLVGQLVDGMHRQAATLERGILPAAADSTIREYLRSPLPRSAARASATLQTLRARDTMLLAIDLRSTDGRVLLAAGEDGRAFPALAPADLPSSRSGNDATAVGRFQSIGDTSVYPVIATVGTPGAPNGLIVEWRYIPPDSMARAKSSAVIGSHAEVIIGSVGGAWTDQVTTVAPPPVRIGKLDGTTRYERAGVKRLAAAAMVPATPWIVVVEFPEAEVLAPAGRFLTRLSLISLLVFGLGLLTAWSFSRSLTAPLKRMTLAAATMATDGSIEPVPVEREDELGQLGTAFNRMVTRVHEETAARDRSEAQWRVLFERSPHARWIYVFDTLKFVAVNDAAVQQYGWSREEFLESTIHLIQPPEDVPLVEERVARARLGGEAHLTARQVKRDGTIFEAEIHSHSTEFAGRAARVVLAEDLSHRQALEQQLRQAQKMEAVGRLAGGVAHDFNNILLVISAYSEMMRDDAGLDPGRRRDLDEIIDAVGRGRSLTRQLLAFSRQQVLQPVILDPNVAVSEMEGMLRRLIGEQIEVVVRLAPDLGQVVADPGQLQQVLLNLAVNARDAMPDGGRLVITTANATIDDANREVHGLERSGEFVTIAVADTGTGMTSEVRARIFEPFFTTKGPGKGTGLGLATAYGIVTQSGGSVTVYSEPGHGTTFRIYLPLVRGTTEAARATARPTGTGGSETILLVEDERAVRAAAAEMLKHLGYQLLIAENGAEAIALAKSAGSQIDLVVSDVVMPRMDGPTLIATLRKDHPGLKAMLMSGYAGDMLSGPTPVDSATLFLEKPFSMADLAAKVREALGDPAAPRAAH